MPAAAPKNDRPRIVWLVLAAALLSGCVTDQASRLQAHAPDGETPAEAMADVSRAMTRGLSAYALVPGDSLEVTYEFSRSRPERAYRLAIGDELDIDFRTQPEYNRRVVVRPDGRISLPAIGDLDSIGLPPKMLAGRIARAYRDLLIDPLVTVIVQSFHTDSDDLKELLQNGAAQRAKTVQVEPDGSIRLPFVPPVHAAGGTVAGLERALDAAYGARTGMISTSVRLAALAPASLFVFGEVQRPGPISASAPRTLLQLIASAGGALPTAATNQIRVVTFDALGGPRVRMVDFDALTRGTDFIVPPNTTIYVPPSRLAKVANFVDLAVRRVLMFNGTSIGLNYGLNRAAQ
jgi:polysaccharide export outer membrane protein